MNQRAQELHLGVERGERDFRRDVLTRPLAKVSFSGLINPGVRKGDDLPLDRVTQRFVRVALM